MGKTISFVKGKGSLRHNNRDFIADNIDKERLGWNEYFIRQPLREAYAFLFDDAVAEYNARQKRSDRKIDDYLMKIKNSGNGEKLFYENVVQLGKKDDTGVLGEDGEISADAKVARDILREYVTTFQERNPNLYLFNAVLHMDEATPHLHLDYIPVARSSYKRGMKVRNSLTKALQEMGIEPAHGKNDNETVRWQKRERKFLAELARERGIEIDVVGVDRDSYTIPEYKQAMREKEAAEEKLAAKEKTLDKILDAGKSVEKEITEIRSQVSDATKSFCWRAHGKASQENL